MNETSAATKLDPKFEVRAKLLLAGLTISSFARKHGFKVQTVDRIITRYFRGEYETARGKVTKAILSKIEEEIGAKDGNRAEEAC